MIRSLMLLLLTLSMEILGQSSTFYYTSFGGYNDDVGNCVIQCMDSDIVIVGESSSFGAAQTDIYISRTDKLMQVKWQKTIGGFSSEVGKSAVELIDSSIVIAGFSNSYGNGGYDAFICKVDKNGNLIWQKTFGGDDWDFANSIDKTSDGNLIICGETYSYGNGNKDGFILKIDQNGNTIWSKIYGGVKEDVLKEIIQTNDGGYIAVGTTMSYGDSLGDIWITKFNSQGDSIHFMTHGGSKKDIGNSIVIDKNGDYLIAGGSESYTNGKEDAYVLKLAPNYTVIWDRFYGQANEDEEVYSIRNTLSTYGSMMICYTTNEVSAYRKDAKALLLDFLGYYIDGGRVGLYENEEVYAIANSIDKGFILTGYTNSFGAIQKDVFVVKFDSLVNGTGQYIVGVDEKPLKRNSIKRVYPNPFSNNISIEMEKNEIINKLEIVNLNGNVLKEIDPLNVEFVNVDLSFLQNGVYILKVYSKLNNYSIKIFCLK